MQISLNIKDNYGCYTQLIEGQKEIQTPLIVLDEAKKSRRNDIREKSVDIRHADIPDNIIFTAEARSDDFDNFKFRLRCPIFDEKPLFRYDSKGPAHRNYGLDVSIDKQQILTPHFHKYNQEGIEIAYKNNILKDSTQANAVKDISLCVGLFCHEANIALSNGNMPELIADSGRLPFPAEDEPLDPLSNVIFE